MNYSYPCILPVLLLGWRVYPCWGLSALSRSPWRCPWACGRARQWGSLPSRSCRMTVPAAGCWMKTGCSMTGSVGHSSQSSRCFRRSPGHPACLEEGICKTEGNQVFTKGTNRKFSVNYFLSTFSIKKEFILIDLTLFSFPRCHISLHFHTSFPFYNHHLDLILSGRRSHKLPYHFWPWGR